MLFFELETVIALEGGCLFSNLVPHQAVVARYEVGYLVFVCLRLRVVYRENSHESVSRVAERGELVADTVKILRR